MYLNHDQIVTELAKGSMQNFDLECVNAASLDVRLGDTIFVEAPHDLLNVVNYSAREKLAMQEINIGMDGVIINPGDFFLAHTIEVCNFPDDLAALFRIKSSMGRIGLEHMDAGWVDPGFNGSLTLEFKNMTKNHSILLHKGDKIGQLIFFRGQSVEEDQSYRTKGNYNGHLGVAQIQFKG